MRTDKICDYHLTVEPAAILNPSFLIDFHGLMDILLSEIYHLTVEPRPIKENILFKNLVIFTPPSFFYVVFSHMRTDKICDYHLTVEPADILNPSFLIDFHGLMDILLSEIYHLTVEPRPIKENILFKNLVIFAPPLIIY